MAGEAGTRAAVPLSGTQAPGSDAAAGPAQAATQKRKKTETPAGTTHVAEVEASEHALLVTCGDTLRRRFGSAERAFAFFDTDADGAVSFAELVAGLGGLGVTMHAREARRVVQACTAASARAGDVRGDVLSRATFAKVFGLEGVRPEAARAVRLVCVCVCVCVCARACVLRVCRETRRPARMQTIASFLCPSPRR